MRRTALGRRARPTGPTHALVPSSRHPWGRPCPAVRMRRPDQSSAAHGFIACEHGGRTATRDEAQRGHTRAATTVGRGCASGWHGRRAALSFDRWARALVYGSDAGCLSRTSLIASTYRGLGRLELTGWAIPADVESVREQRAAVQRTREAVARQAREAAESNSGSFGPYQRRAPESTSRRKSFAS
jgi:hypothetical protein